jgi:hypothetical protein
MSRIGQVLKYAKTHEDKTKLARVICGVQEDVFTDEARDRMAVGSEYESVVRDWYADQVQEDIQETGLWIYGDNPVFGGSPDGLLGEDDIIEIKIIERDIPTKYSVDYSEIPISHYWQMQGNMFILNKKNCDYVVFSRLSGRVYIRKIPLDKAVFEKTIVPGCMEFYEEYMVPVIREYGLMDPYQDYKRRVKSMTEEH